MYDIIVISSGHAKKVQGAVGIINEVEEARLIVDQLAVELRDRGIKVHTFHDDTSTTQSQNLDTIVKKHNSYDRDLDVSVHFNAFQKTEKPMGTEVLYKSQKDLAGKVAAAIASVGFINRGAKKRDDLAFLNGTKEPAILIEVCFVDSQADVNVYEEHFDTICAKIADVLGDEEKDDVEVA